MTSSPESTADPAALPGFAEVEAAARRLSGTAVETPLLNFPALDAAVGGTVLIKPETLQRTGSFKFRGAYNKISQLSRPARQAGVVAFSSGNHAQGVAHAAQLCGVPATIVMPADAPRIKVDNTRGYGADVRLYDRYFEDREAVAAEIVAETGATLVRPYDDPDVIAGQGTCGLEISRQAQARGLALDAVLICCGGGGLAAGSSLALRAETPGTEIFVVEPAGFDDHARSLASGTRQGNEPGVRSFCDALLAPRPGEMTFAINRRTLTGGLAVTDEDVRAAMAFAFRTLKLVIEPGGAVCLAAVLTGKLPVAGRTIALTLSGGNVDAETFCQAIGA